MKFKGYIFDIDGTLASTNKLIFDSFNHVTKKYMGKEHSSEEIIGYFGPPEDVILEELMGNNLADVKRDYYNYYEKHHNRIVEPRELIYDSIKLLKLKGKKLGIFTGKGRTSAEITLRALGIFDYFEFIATGDDVVNHKPHPEGILEFIKFTNLLPKEVIMIGDAPSDIKAAREAGVNSAVFMWDCYAKEKVWNLNADYYFESPEEFQIALTNAIK